MSQYACTERKLLLQRIEQNLLIRLPRMWRPDYLRP
uniref:Uncharacterized protein n=1 Tax=Arundo donax TaxID=35708 RepID=A0A0A9EPH1_ARUDO